MSASTVLNINNSNTYQAGEAGTDAPHLCGEVTGVSRGRITNKDNFNSVLSGLEYSNNRALVIESEPMAHDRSHICESMFEHLLLDSVGEVLGTQAVLMASGRTTGIALDVGHDLIQANCIYNGFCLQVSC